VSHRLTGDAPACVLRPETTNEARPRILHKGLETTGVARQAKQRPGPVDLSAERTSGANPGATDAGRGQQASVFTAFDLFDPFGTGGVGWFAR